MSGRGCCAGRSAPALNRRRRPRLCTSGLGSGVRSLWKVCLKCAATGCGFAGGSMKN